MEIYRVLVCFVFIIYTACAFPNTKPTEDTGEKLREAIDRDIPEGTDPKKYLKNFPDGVKEIEDEPYKCPTPVPPEHGNVTGDDYNLGATLTVHCNPGYKLQGSPTVRCLAVPDPWKHVVIWDPPIPTCIQAQETQNKVSSESQDDEEDETVEKNENIEENESVEENQNEITPPPPLLSQGPPKSPEDDHASKVQEMCDQVPDSGSCNDDGPFTVIFYYDKVERECKKLSVCSGHGENNFSTHEECINLCVTSND